MPLDYANNTFTRLIEEEYVWEATRNDAEIDS